MELEFQAAVSQAVCAFTFLYANTWCMFLLERFTNNTIQEN